MKLEKISTKESQPKSLIEKGSWVNIIEVVQSPLQFYVLAVLIVEGILGVTANFSDGIDKTYLIVGMLLIMIILLVIVGIIAYFRPESLRGNPVLSQITPELKNIIDESIRIAIGNIKFSMGNKKIQAVLENRDIYLSVCLFRDGKTDKQREQNKKTLNFYRDLQKNLETVVQKDKRKVVTRRDFYEDEVISPGKMPNYANEAFDKIARCKYFIAVIQKLPDEVSGGSHLIEIGYALAKGIPVLCYIEEGMYKPMFLRELNKPSHYKLIPYSNAEELFTRLDAVDTDFNSIESI